MACTRYPHVPRSDDPGRRPRCCQRSGPDQEKGSSLRCQFLQRRIGASDGCEERGRAPVRLAASNCRKTSTEWSSANAELKALGVAPCQINLDLSGPRGALHTAPNGRYVLRQRMYDNRPCGRSCTTNEEWSKVFVDPGQCSPVGLLSFFNSAKNADRCLRVIWRVDDVIPHETFHAADNRNRVLDPLRKIVSRACLYFHLTNRGIHNMLPALPGLRGRPDA